MGSDFFKEGGFGMYPVTVFGFLQIVVCVLYTLRLRPHHARLSCVLGGATLMAGVLGTATGICTTAFYIQKVEQPKQLEIFALGLQESLHDIVLALVFVIIASLIACVAILRDAKAKAAA